MIDTTEPGTPGWWLARLMGRLADKRAHYQRLDDYYDGRNSIPIASSKSVTDAYQRLMHVSRTNFAELVVEAVRERMMPVGFRTGAANDENGDEMAWRIWLANHLQAGSQMVGTASLSMGMGYVIVGDIDPELGVPLITPEDPREVIVETDPRNRRKGLAALKVFRDDVAGVDRAYVYLPGGQQRFVRLAPMGDAEVVSLDVGGWEIDGPWEPDSVPHLRVVPFPNRPKLGREITRGEYETHISLLDRINYTVLQRVEVATLQAFRQRALKGGPTHDEDGNEIDYDDIFAMEPGAIWHLPETAELWESGQVDLGPIRMAIRDDVQDLAAVTRTPLFYLTPEAANGSAEGASLAREGLVFKTRDRIVEATESWSQAMSLAFRVMGDAVRADRVALEVIWASPENWSLSEKADAASKAMAGGLTWRKTMEEIWQFSPEEISQMEADRASEMLMAQSAAAIGGLIGEPDPGSLPPSS